MTNNEIKKLLKRQKACMNAILTMTKNLFEVQEQISKICLQELETKPEKDNQRKELMNTKELCNELGISTSTLYRMRKEDDFPCRKIEGRKSIWYNRSEVEEYMKRNK